MNLPKISIITVVYNGENIIEETVQSVVNQDYPNIEYIVVDGLSKDKTLDILAKYKDKISILISEKDKGIYDAMNKGQNVATGDYVWFLNGGDFIPTHSTVSEIFKKAQNQDVVYGHAMIVDEKGNEKGLRRLIVPENLKPNSFLSGMVICHQAMLVKRSISVQYDLNFKIAADIDWAIRSCKNIKSSIHTHLVVCKYLEGGFSDKKRKESLVERFNIMKKEYGLFNTILGHIGIVINLILFKLGIKKNKL